jgi:uncharacterized protein
VLQIRAVEIPAEGLALKVSDASWFPAREVPRQGDPQVDVFLSRRNERIFLSGAIDLIMLLTCDRCLEEFALPRSIKFEVVFDLSGEDPALLAREYECDINEMDVVFLEEPVIDLGVVLAQQVLLAVPRKNLCRSDCRGICPVCGAERNKKNCGCAVGGGDSPFGALSRLTKKKNSR